MTEKKKLTLEDARHALAEHLIEKALMIREKYGPRINEEALKNILMDREYVRYPVSLTFATDFLEEGMFARAQPVSENPDEGYEIQIHPYFKNQPEALPALVLYHLVVVNYGDLVTYQEAELFGATVLGMDREDYYQLICQLADKIS